MSGTIEITETWTSVDRWWTDAPLVRHFAALRSPDIQEDVRVCVCYDEALKMWTLIEEPSGPSDS